MEAIQTQVDQARSLLSLDELKQVLTDLEGGAFASLTDAEIREKIVVIQNGFVIRAPILEAGTVIYRAVRVSERPAHKSRVSYPPLGAVTANGRLNRAGEQMFYGSLDQFAPCLHECSCKVGEFFAVSGWITTRRMLFNHLGYSTSASTEFAPKRALPHYVRIEEDTERNRLIREWQARVFTKQISARRSSFLQIDYRAEGLCPRRGGSTRPEYTRRIFGCDIPLNRNGPAGRQHCNQTSRSRLQSCSV